MYKKLSTALMFHTFHPRDFFRRATVYSSKYIYVELISEALTKANVSVTLSYKYYVEAVLVKNAAYRPITRAGLGFILCKVTVRMKLTNVKANARINML